MLLGSGGLGGAGGRGHGTGRVLGGSVRRRVDDEAQVALLRLDLHVVRGRYAERRREHVLLGDAGERHARASRCAAQGCGTCEHERQLGGGNGAHVEHDGAGVRLGAIGAHAGERNELGGVAAGKGHVVAYAARAHDALRKGAGVGVDVGGEDARRAILRCLGAGVCLVEEGVPGCLVVLRPALKAPTRAGNARGAVEGAGGGFELYAATGARKVHEHGLLFGGARRGPAGELEREGGVVGAQHRRGAGSRRLAGEALEERVSGEVEAERNAAARERDADAGVGVLRVNVGAASALLGQPVAHGVFDAQGREVRVAQLGRGAAGGHGKGGSLGEHLFPGNVARRFVQLVGGLRGGAAEHEKHAARQARPEAHAVGVRGVSLKADAALERAHARRIEPLELGGEGCFKAGRAACVEFHGRSSRLRAVLRCAPLYKRVRGGVLARGFLRRDCGRLPGGRSGRLLLYTVRGRYEPSRAGAARRLP